MTGTTDDRTSKAAMLLFLLLSIALAGVVHVGQTEPALERLEERRETRRVLEWRARESGLERERKHLQLRALDDDPQTQEAHLRRQGFGDPGEIRLVIDDESR